MKNYLLGAALCSLFFAACSKKSTPALSPGMTAKINGATWTATTFSFSIDSSDPAKPFLMVIGYVGSDSTGTNISLGIADFHGTGSFILGTNLETEYDDHSRNAWFPGNTGTVTITKSTPDNVQGTFSFTATGYYNITNGQFNVPRK